MSTQEKTFQNLIYVLESGWLSSSAERVVLQSPLRSPFQSHVSFFSESTDRKWQKRWWWWEGVGVVEWKVEFWFYQLL